MRAWILFVILGSFVVVSCGVNLTSASGDDTEDDDNDGPIVDIIDDLDTGDGESEGEDTGEIKDSDDPPLTGVQLKCESKGDNLSLLSLDLGGPDDWGNPNYFTELNGKLYFAATTPEAGAELMVYDSASNSVALASDINPGPDGSGLRDLVAHAGKIYFQASDIPEDGVWDTELFEFDPANGRSTKIDLNSAGSSMPTDFFSASNDLLYFRARLGENNDQELWEYDPSTGQHTVYEIFPGMGLWDQPNRGVPKVQLEYDGKLYMQADGPEGKELYSFDLVSKQITLEADIAPGMNESGSHPMSSYPTWLTLFNDEIYFNAAIDGAMDEELWIFNPTTGAVREIEIDDGQNMFAGSLVESGGSPTYLTPYDGKLYFRAQQVPVGIELFVYDPVTGEVSLVWDSAPGQYEHCGGQMGAPPCLTFGNDGNTSELTLNDGVFYFVAPFDNRELWSYDLATGEGGQLLEIYPGTNEWGNPGHAEPSHLTMFDGKLIFQATSDTLEDELFAVSWDQDCP